MILQCPECDTRFLVDASVIPAEGRTVKCAKCAHQWFVKPEENDTSDVPAAQPDSEEETVEPHITFGDGESDTGAMMAEEYDIPLSPHVEIVQQRQKVSALPMLMMTVFLMIIAAGLGLVVFRGALQPALAPVYALMGMYPTDGLALANVEFRERLSRSKARFVVEGHIVNNAEEPRAVPLLRVAIADASGEWIVSREYEAEGDILQPGESYPFKATNLDTSFIDRVDHLVVEIGSDTELMLRK